MKHIKRWQVLLTALAITAGAAVQTVSAQSNGSGNGGPGGPGPNGPGRGGLGLATVCSTTNYTDVAAKALGMTSTDLRVALVSGKTITTLAISKNVPLQTVADALNTAQKADLDQALKDGLLTQAQYDAIVARMSAPVAAQATPDATEAANGPANEPGNGPANSRGPGRFGLRVSPFNTVNREIVVAQALNMSCPDLVKAMQGGQTIAQIAASKNVAVQTVIDALTAAYKAAWDQDVKEGLITQAQEDSRLSQLQSQGLRLLTNPGPGFRGPRPGNNGQFPGPGRGQPGNGPATPPAAPTAAVNQS